MNEKVFVVSGTHDQYKNWVKTNMPKYYSANQSVSLSNFVYVSGPEVMRGFNKVHGVFTGTYKDRPDIREIVRMIRMINKIDHSVQLIPDIFVGRGFNWHAPLPDPAFPFPTRDMQVAFNGVIQTGGFIATIKGQELTIQFHDAPPLGVMIQVAVAMKSSSLSHGAIFHGNGSIKMFTMKVY